MIIIIIIIQHLTILYVAPRAVVDAHIMVIMFITICYDYYVSYHYDYYYHYHAIITAICHAYHTITIIIIVNHYLLPRAP